VTNPVTSRELGDGTVRISPRGEIDLDNAYLIREAVDAALVRGAPSKIVIDLGGVSLIDSVGIGVLVSCYHAATASRVPLEAADASTMVYRQLWVTGLVGLFGLATPRPDADAVAGHS
jgi:anti-anti-sigma factor